MEGQIYNLPTLLKVLMDPIIPLPSTKVASLSSFMFEEACSAICMNSNFPGPQIIIENKLINYLIQVSKIMIGLNFL